MRTAVLALLLVLPLGCSPRPVADDARGTARLAGTWRAVLTSPGGELPFVLRLERRGDGLAAVIVNGEEEAPVSTVEAEGSRLVLRFDGYDSRIEARVAPDGESLDGIWERTGPKGVGRMPFAAHRVAQSERFHRLANAGLAGSPGAPPSIAGTWAAQFVDEDGSSPAQGELRQEGARVTGTFLTPTGDYRYLEGTYEDGVLRLSTFDGAHAFLFQARGRADGTLAGDFWSRESYHAAWTARRVADGTAVLPDAWSQVGLTNRDGRLHFRFPDLGGRPVSLDDPRFAGKVVLVNLFGSWCPNCNDEAPQLAAWYRRYHGRGLEIVGLAYEMTGDPKRDTEFVRRFRTRHGIDYPLLLAGTSDKKAAARTLPDLTAVVAFPTTLFVARDGRVRRIYTGYEGPATGAHNDRLMVELASLIERLLVEPVPSTPEG